MEKRAFVAVILMFLVLLTYQIMSRPPGGSAPETTATDSVAAMAEDRAEAAEVERVDTGERGSAVSQDVPEKRIVVESDLWKAVLSNQGPRILSWQLKEFAGTDSDWAELVADSAGGGLRLGVWTAEGLCPADRVYEVNVDRLTLDALHPSGELVFTSVDSAGPTITQTLRFQSSSYLVAVHVSVRDLAVERGDEILMGWTMPLPSTEPNRKEEERYFAALASVDSELLKRQVKHLKKEPSRLRRGDVHWAGIKTKYFTAALVPDEGSGSAIELGGEREAESLGFSVVFPAKADGGWELGAQVYVGPIDYRILKGCGFGLERVVDFGHKFIRPLSKLIYWMLVTTYKWIPNYGVVIIILSTLTKVLFYPLTQKSMKSMQSMQQLQPKMAALKEKHKSDPKRMNQEVMKLYKEHGVNPVGGCLPLLLQSPVFFALYAVLQRTIELRRAPFVLWINDLSRPDQIFSLPDPLPALSLLPILMGASMFWQQRMSASGGGDPRQKMMGYMMPIFLMVIFFRMPSGLVLYWLVNTILSIGQQYIMARRDLASKSLQPAE